MKLKLVTALTITAVMLAACGGDDSTTTTTASAPPAVTPPAVTPPATPQKVTQLFAQTNDAQNAVLHFVRNADGTLTAMPSLATGGKGTNGVNYFMGNTVAPDALTSNNSLIVSPDGTRLFVANAGDNTVSVFSISGSTLSLLAVSPTGGTRPTSLAFSNGVLYVTHQQGAQELGAYLVGDDGKLSAIGQYAVVVQDALPTQVSLSPDGKFVIVNGFLRTVTPTAPLNTLLAFPVQADGTLGTPVNSTSAGVGPFGGRFGTGALASTYVVTDAPGGSVESFSFSEPSGNFTSTGAPVTVTGQAAPCWISLTPDNRFAYIGNGSGAVSLFSIDGAGKLTLVNASAAAETPVAGQSSAFANDSWVSPDGKFLYQDYAGDDKIVAYAIGADGALSKLGEQPANTQSKISLQGLTGI
ncbi:lactonase family protein [Burkholderia gladioli]|uniref:3-carboxymuconate cyclase n=1 Tax=Burkholderia gladioli (strain BSR3) TaxID=999541 RepID=F2LBQ4_BURGS|nr:beta-propeller fold lactonase family protein [Burkholderia gladioli]AEA61429.1 3-carboxymuconate cyclase [Burkholderia gladioli BSR3]